MTITAAQIQSASQALRSVLRFDYPADSVLSRYFRDLRELGARDRAFVAEAVYGVLRRLRTLERLCGEDVSTRKLVLAWLARVEGLTLHQLGDGLHGRDTDFFTQVKGREIGELSFAESADLPDWLAERLLASRSEAEVLALAQSLNRPAPLDLRANSLKLDRDALVEKLRAELFRLGGETGQNIDWATAEHLAFADERTLVDRCIGVVGEQRAHERRRQLGTGGQQQRRRTGHLGPGQVQLGCGCFGDRGQFRQRHRGDQHDHSSRSPDLSLPLLKCLDPLGNSLATHREQQQRQCGADCERRGQCHGIEPDPAGRVSRRADSPIFGRTTGYKRPNWTWQH